MEERTKRTKLLLSAAGGFILIGAIFFFYWLQVLRFQEYTDDAYVNGNKVALMPQISGIVSSIYVDNTDYVKENQVILELDKTDFQLALKKSVHSLGETVRQVIQMFLKVEEQEAELTVRKAALVQAEQDYENRVSLVSVGGVSKEEFEHMESARLMAYGAYQEVERSLQATAALVQNTTIRTHPLVLQAVDQVKDAWINLKRCEIVSPVSGYIAMRQVQLGESVSPGTPLLAIIPLSDLWVDANFKEVKLSKMRRGQPVQILSDIYGGDVIFRGKIIGINPGTGSVFSALPPQNATGNWIKIVQRVPVRISLDPDQIKKNPLWPGLSMDVTVDIHDTSGEMLAEEKCSQPLYQTAVYSQQEEGAVSLIEAVMQENIGSYE